MSRTFCKRCFFAEIDRDGIYKEISRIISDMPEEKRTEEAEYQRRLDICEKCDSLGEGTCGKCGCFVELRAAKKDMHCPSEKHFW
ncbi:MAG: DUF6171 family protein [Wujia sp.]